MSLSVIKVVHTSNFTVISNQMLRDTNLSMNSAGLLVRVLSLPEDWEYSVEGLSKAFNCSRNTISKYLKELEDNGYLERKKVRDSKGRYYTEYTFYEESRTKKPYLDNQAWTATPGQPHLDLGHNKINIQKKEDKEKKSKDVKLNSLTNQAPNSTPGEETSGTSLNKEGNGGVYNQPKAEEEKVTPNPLGKEEQRLEKAIKDDSKDIGAILYWFSKLDKSPEIKEGLGKWFNAVGRGMRIGQVIMKVEDLFKLFSSEQDIITRINLCYEKSIPSFVFKTDKEALATNSKDGRIRTVDTSAQEEQQKKIAEMFGKNRSN